MAAKFAFEKGIALMRKRIATLEQSGTSHEDEKLSVEKEKEIGDLKYEISSAFVSIAELFMTDLCDEDDAETECEKYLNLSLAADPTNIETYAAFGQFRHCHAGGLHLAGLRSGSDHAVERPSHFSTD